MKIVQQIQDFLDTIDTKDFYKYIGGIILAIVLVFCLLVYRFYSNVSYYKGQLKTINNQREEIRELLDIAALTKEQKQTINAMLEANPDFKIAGYFKKVLDQLGLTQKETSNTVTSQERGEQNYNEIVLSAKFTDMTMKDLTELLNVLEKNKRIYTKDLEIQRPKKAQRTIDVQLTIATLQPRTEPIEYTE